MAFPDGLAAPPRPVVDALLAAAVLLTAAGVNGPIVMRTMRRARRAVAARRSLRQLYPLWRLVAGAVPHIALARGGNAPAAGTLGDAHLRAVRRVVEIRDGMLALAPYGSRGVLADAEHDASAAGLSGDDARATGEAAWLRAAAAAKRAGRPPDAAARAPTGGGRDLEEEIAWLARVATAFRRTPEPE